METIPIRKHTSPQANGLTVRSLPALKLTFTGKFEIKIYCCLEPSLEYLKILFKWRKNIFSYPRQMILDFGL